MKKLTIDYILYIYHKFIQTEDIYKEWAKPFIKLVDYVYIIYILFFAIVFLPFLLILMKIEEYFEKHKQYIIDILTNDMNQNKQTKTNKV